MGADADLRTLLASRYPLLIVESRDEPHFMRLVRFAADVVGAPLWKWSATEGLARVGYAPQFGTADPNRALAFVQEITGPGVFVFADAQPLLADRMVLRRVKEIAQASRRGQTLVVTGTGHAIPDELADLALPWVEPPPSPEELESMIRGLLEDLAVARVAVAIGPAELHGLVSAVRGMSMGEAERLIRRASADDGHLDAADVERIRKMRAATARETGSLEIVDARAALDDVGGMEHLKEWLAVRAKAVAADAAALGIDPPRGILLTGVPGCGKSMMAKAVAQAWGLPLALLDPARLFGSYVGESEQRLQRALEQADAMAPVVLWIDEIEKGFSEGGEADGGVSQRLLGTFLRWMQERQPGVFLVATSNDVRRLPAEFLRKGRFDEVFFVDLPGADERAGIFRTHLVRRHRDQSKFDLGALAAASDGFSGAEIEAAVVGALYRAFGAGSELTTDSILAEVRGTVPLSRSRSEDVVRLRAWAAERAVAA
jgi:AAA+ superfamily predicted ATPase